MALLDGRAEGATLDAMSLPELERSFLSVKATARGTTGVEVVFTGTADLRVQAALGDFLNALHAEATRLGASVVGVDVRGLEFMSSACFRQIISWVSKVEDAGRPYRISVLASLDRQWQRRSMHALSSYAGDFVTVVPSSERVSARDGETRLG
jgi:hypothetical protein